MLQNRCFIGGNLYFKQSKIMRIFPLLFILLDNSSCIRRRADPLVMRQVIWSLYCHNKATGINEVLIRAYTYKVMCIYDDKNTHTHYNIKIQCLDMFSSHRKVSAKTSPGLLTIKRRCPLTQYLISRWTRCTSVYCLFVEQL